MDENIVCMLLYKKDWFAVLPLLRMIQLERVKHNPRHCHMYQRDPQIPDGMLSVGASVEGSLIAVAVGKTEQENGSNIAYINDLYIIDSYKDEQLEMALVDMFAQSAKERGCSELHLDEGVVTPSSAMFYQDLGFSSQQSGSFIKVF